MKRKASIYFKVNDKEVHAVINYLKEYGYEHTVGYSSENHNEIFVQIVDDKFFFCGCPHMNAIKINSYLDIPPYGKF